MQQNGGIAGAGSLGAGIGALMQTLGNLNQGQRNNTGSPAGGAQQGSVFNRLGTPGGQGKPAAPAGQSPWQKNNASPANSSPAAKKNESPQKDTPVGGKEVAESPAAAAKSDEGFKTPQNTPSWQQRNQGGGNQSGGGGGGGRWGPSPNQNQQNSGGRNQGGGGRGGGNWQQRNNQNQQSPAAAAADDGQRNNQNQQSPAAGGDQRDGQRNNQNQQSPAAGGGQRGNWQGGQNRGGGGQNRGGGGQNRGGGGRWGQNRGGDGDETSPQQQNENDTPRRGGPQGGRQGGRGGRNESPQNRNNYGGGRGGGGGGYGGGRGGYRGGYDKIKEKVMQLSGPQVDLPPMEFTEKKFNANSRLFVGNLPRDLTEEELKEMFSKYGELGPFYFNKEGSYAFINFDFRCNAEKAKRELQSHVLKGRTMKVRVASVTTGVRVKNLSPLVSNELLNLAFSAFGEVESCRVLVNERGKATGEGVVIFADKKSWTTAIRKCEEECYFLTSDTRPAVVEPMDAKEEEEGLPEINMPKNHSYQQERCNGPRFADHNSFEFDYGQRYKRLFEIYKERKASLDRDFAVELDQLEAKMAIAKHDFETEQLRRELERREADMDRLRRRAGFAGVGDNYGGGAGGMDSGYGGGGMGDSGQSGHGGGYGGAGGAQQGGVRGGYGGDRGAGPQQSGGYGGDRDRGAGDLGAGPQQAGSGFGGNDSQFRGGAQAPATQGGYGGSPAMQVKKVVPEKQNENEKGEDYQRGVKRPAIGDLEQDKPSLTATDGPEFKRRF